MTARLSPPPRGPERRKGALLAVLLAAPLMAYLILGPLGPRHELTRVRLGEAGPQALAEERAAAPGPGAAGHEASAGSAVVAGTVVDARGEPVTRFTIDVVSPGGGGAAPREPLCSRRFESADGSFRLDRVPSGRVYLRAVTDEHAPAFSAGLDVGPHSVHQVTLAAAPGCTLIGDVEDENGEPVPGLVVAAELRERAADGGDAVLDAASKDGTDAEGLFRLERVPTGDVLVRAYRGDRAVAALSLEIALCEDLQAVKLHVPAGGELTLDAPRAPGEAVASADLAPPAGDVP